MLDAAIGMRLLRHELVEERIDNDPHRQRVDGRRLERLSSGDAHAPLWPLQGIARQIDTIAPPLDAVLPRNARSAVHDNWHYQAAPAYRRRNRRGRPLRAARRGYGRRTLARDRRACGSRVPRS